MTPANPSLENTQSNIIFIQILRGLAAMAVVILHTGWDHTENDSIRHALSSGIAGVDLFFLISGFIMFYSIDNHTKDPDFASKFAIKRIARIWPPYAVWTLLIVGLFTLFPSSNVQNLPTGLSEIIHSLTFLPTTRPFFPPAYTLPVLDVGWTLCYEIYFYVVLYGCLLSGHYKWLLFCVWLTIAMLLVPYMQHHLTFDPNQMPKIDAPLSNMLTSPIMWEFPAGMLIGFFYRKNIRIQHTALAWFLFICSILLLIEQCIMTAKIQHGLADLGWPLLLVMWTMSWLSFDPNKLPCRVLLWLGKISFSVYLVHRPVVIAIETILSIRMVQLAPMEFVIFILFSSAASIAVGWLSFKYLELGLSNHIRDKLLSMRRQQPA